MPHILYNQITHSWDLPDSRISGSSAGAGESPDFTPAVKTVVAHVAAAGASTFLSLVFWGLIAGAVVGVR